MVRISLIMSNKKYTELKNAELVGKSVSINAHKFVVIEDISKYLYGDGNFIKKSTANHAIRPIVEMMEKGKTKEEILNFIERNISNYNGKAYEMYTHIAKIVDYGKHGTWAEYYENTMNPIIDKLKKGKQLTKVDLKKQAEVYQKQLIRKSLIKEYKNLSIDEMMEVIRKTRKQTIRRCLAWFKR